MGKIGVIVLSSFGLGFEVRERTKERKKGRERESEERKS